MKNLLYKIVRFLTTHVFKVVIILILVLFVVGIFFWLEVRPSLIKSRCYTNAKEMAIEKTRGKAEAPYLYDRNHWKDYGKTKYDINTGTITFDNAGSFDPNSTEPSYIQENLTRITQDNTFDKDDYNTYYKWCLESKGL